MRSEIVDSCLLAAVVGDQLAKLGEGVAGTRSRSRMNGSCSIGCCRTIRLRTPGITSQEQAVRFLNLGDHLLGMDGPVLGGGRLRHRPEQDADEDRLREHGDRNDQDPLLEDRERSEHRLSRKKRRMRESGTPLPGSRDRRPLDLLRGGLAVNSLSGAMKRSS